LTKTELVQNKNRVDFSADRVGANKNRVGFIDAIALPVVITTHSHINNFETNSTPYFSAWRYQAGVFPKTCGFCGWT